ncbi:hypothetical protein V8E51_009975 [Hyaloscypha variabilis]
MACPWQTVGAFKCDCIFISTIQHPEVSEVMEAIALAASLPAICDSDCLDAEAAWSEDHGTTGRVEAGQIRSDHILLATTFDATCTNDITTCECKHQRPHCLPEEASAIRRRPPQSIGSLTMQQLVPPRWRPGGVDTERANQTQHLRTVGRAGNGVGALAATPSFEIPLSTWWKSKSSRLTPKSSINSSREKATSPDPSEDYDNQVRRVVLELPNLEKKSQSSPLHPKRGNSVPGGKGPEGN